MRTTKLSECRILELPSILDIKKGNLTFIQENTDVPFKIKRVFFIYGVPKGEKRGNHAMKKSQEVIIAIRGNLDVILNDGVKKKKFRLNRPDQGLFVPTMIWQELTTFSADSLCLVLASEFYDKREYVSDHDHYRQIMTAKKKGD